MPIPLLEIATADRSMPFASQVLGALQRAIICVQQETCDTPDHRVRMKFAELAQMKLGEYALAMCVAVASTLPASYDTLENVSDADVQSGVDSLFTVIAFEVVLPT